MESFYGLLHTAFNARWLVRRASARKSVTSARPAAPSDAGPHRPLSAVLNIIAGLVQRAVSRDTASLGFTKRKKTLGNVHLDGLIATAMDAIIMVDDKQDIILFNRAAERMFGYAQSEIIGQPLGTLLPSHVQAAHARHVDGFGRSGVCSRRMGCLDSISAMRANGTEFPVEASISHFKVDKQVFYTAVIRDVSERTHIIAELRTSEERERAHAKQIKNILFAVPAAVCIAHDRALSHITENELHSKWFGSPAPDGPTPHATPFRHALERAVNGTEVRNYRFSELSREGTLRHFLGNAIPLWDADMMPTGAVCAFVDVTELKMSESKVLAATQGSDAKSDYITHMTHELRTPLGIMLGHAQLLERAKPSLCTKQLVTISQILKAGWHLRALIDEVQQLSIVDAQVKRATVECIDIDRMFEELRAMIAPLLLVKNISAFFKTEGNVAIKGNLQHCKQVMLNLLSNAIKYNRYGGTIHVSCETVPRDSVRITVRDTGNGLDTEQLARLFQPFDRLGQEAGQEVGTGVGLIVTKRLVEAMGGLIGVNSTPGHGTSFWVSLPVVELPATA